MPNLINFFLTLPYDSEVLQRMKFIEIIKTKSVSIIHGRLDVSFCVKISVLLLLGFWKLTFE